MYVVPNPVNPRRNPEEPFWEMIRRLQSWAPENDEQICRSVKEVHLDATILLKAIGVQTGGLLKKGEACNKYLDEYLEAEELTRTWKTNDQWASQQMGWKVKQTIRVAAPKTVSREKGAAIAAMEAEKAAAAQDKHNAKEQEMQRGREYRERTR